MRIEPLPLAGAALIRLDKRSDERGWFARSFCAEAFAAAGLPSHFPQHNLSFNALAGTLRGLHFQRPPHGEAKVISAARGAIFDVIVDLRAGSPTYGRWYAAELTAAGGDAVFAPEGFAHGFQTLTDEAEVRYLMGRPHVPGAAAGVRYDDPRLGIAWPLPVRAISARDLALPLLDEAGR